MNNSPSTTSHGNSTPVASVAVDGDRAGHGGPSSGDRKPGRGSISDLMRRSKENRNRWILFILVVLLGLLGSYFYNDQTEKKIPFKGYSELLSDAKSGSISKILIIPGYISETAEVTLKGGKDGEPLKYMAKTPGMDAKAIDRFIDAGIAVKIADEPFDISRHFGTMILLALMVMMFYSMNPSGGKKQTRSTKDRFARLIGRGANEPVVTFADVAGVEEAKRAMSEVVDYLRNPAKYEAMGAAFPKGIMLYGEPGTGKTLLARAVAGEAGAGFIHISGSDFTQVFMGMSSRKIKATFAQARRMAPCIVFIDEIDAVGGKRLNEGTAVARELGSMLNTLLVEMDGFESNSGVAVIGATNRLEVLDPALLRSGRFDRRIQISAPNLSERQEILRIHGRKLPVDENLDYAGLAKQTIGMSGADLANVMNQAALIAVREDAKMVGMRHALKARDVVLMGEERRSTALAIDDKTRRILAGHEAGHAIAALASGQDPVTRVSIIPRGPALGVTFMSPLQDRFLFDDGYLTSQIRVLLGGRAAERYLFACSTTGARDDLTRATQIAMEMVCVHGMSKLGMLNIRPESSDGRKYDAEMEAKSILKREFSEVMWLLEANRGLLLSMMDTLIEQEEISESEIASLVKQHALVCRDRVQADDAGVTDSAPIGLSLAPELESFDVQA